MYPDPRVIASKQRRKMPLDDAEIAYIQNPTPQGAPQAPMSGAPMAPRNAPPGPARSAAPIPTMAPPPPPQGMTGMGRTMADPMQTMNMGNYALDQPQANRQFTGQETDALAELGMYDEKQEQVGRKMAMAQSLRAQGAASGPRGGTYGRWGTPMPYSKGEAIVGGLTQAGGAFMQRRAEKEATANRQQAQDALKMYEERTRNPRGQVSQQAAEDLSKITPPKVSLGAESVWEKIKSAGRRYF